MGVDQHRQQEKKYFNPEMVARDHGHHRQRESESQRNPILGHLTVLAMNSFKIVSGPFRAVPSAGFCSVGTIISTSSFFYDWADAAAPVVLRGRLKPLPQSAAERLEQTRDGNPRFLGIK